MSGSESEGGCATMKSDAVEKEIYDSQAERRQDLDQRSRRPAVLERSAGDRNRDDARLPAGRPQRHRSWGIVRALAARSRHIRSLFRWAQQPAARACLPGAAAWVINGLKMS